ncbi:D-alanyl-D-alanine carboxypeptidase [candidate division WWE3 bacterium]|uniref:D-alanyl-D-alanine carboxypeptidase n=1 Tax=candidate division WWE3 bacterium TaxID=2053526 RepID=A0A7X9DK18_UNCKA|nr:D-alanyl-D-alanine carboxypeptidase [candidate division WWE3 bacterium]
MKYSLVQKIEIWLLGRLVNVLWIIDIATGYPLNQSVKFAAKPFVFVSLILIGVLTYFIYVPFLSERFSVFNLSNNPKIALNSTPAPEVLGAGVPLVTIPTKIPDAMPFPEVSAKSVIVADVNSNTILHSISPEKKLASASTTKLMTALVSLNIYSLEDELTMSKECSEVESTRADLPPGEKFTVNTLLNAMLVYSAGDAACLLGTGKIDSNEFLYLMNEMAYDLKMENTFFTNTIGLDGLNGAQFSSAKDLYLLARATMAKPILKEIVAKPQVTVSSADGAFSTNLQNTNRLLAAIPNSVGIKTGTTQEAGEVLIYEYSKDTTDVMIIVMGSQDRFVDTTNILDWTLHSYTWVN